MAKRGRKKVVVNRELLVSCINKLEDNQTYPNESHLFIAVGESMGLTPAVVRLRVKEFGLTYKTVKGKRGSGLGGPRKPRVSRASKFANQATQNALKALESEVKSAHREGLVGPSALKLVQKIREGSITAAVKLNCMSCVGFCEGAREEIRECTVLQCPMYVFRPYQVKALENE